MTKTEKFLALFPLKGEVTEGIIRNSRNYNPYSCTGALTLSSALGVEGIMLIDERLEDKKKLCWGRVSGTIEVEGKEYYVTTEEGMDMFIAPDPKQVTFIIKEKEYDEIKALFPINAEITKEILDSADIKNPAHCVGTSTLREAIGDKLPKDAFISWNDRYGSIVYKGNQFDITTSQEVAMMSVTQPRSVTFELMNKEQVKLAYSDTDSPNLLDQTDDSKKETDLDKKE